MDRLRGRNAIVTGASRGLGVHIAQVLAAEGVNVVLSARSLEPTAALAAQLAGTGVRALAIAGDVSNPTDRQQLVERARAELGPIDILVNNAALEANSAFADFPPEEVERMLAVDLVAPMLLTQQLLPEMLERKSGHVVNVSSLAGKSATPYNVPYSAAKGGLILFTHSLRAELRGTGVSTSVIIPGYISQTGIFADKAREHDVEVPLIAGTSTPKTVAKAVVRAIRKDQLEIIVAPGPMRLSQAFNQLFPEAFAWFVTRAGAMDPFRKAADNARSQPER